MSHPSEELREPSPTSMPTSPGYTDTSMGQALTTASSSSGAKGSPCSSKSHSPAGSLTSTINRQNGDVSTTGSVNSDSEKKVSRE